MAVYKDMPEVEIRERRLNAILSYQGDAETLNIQSKKRKVKCPGSSYNQCSQCAEGCAETITYHVIGAAVVSHAPIGCSIGVSPRHILSRAVSKNRGLPEHKVQMISSNINEEDTVYGASKKLFAAIYEADRRFKPKTIFLQASCASGIIGEDMESIARQAEEKLHYPVVPVYCEGFKSNIWSTGFDAAFHAVLRRLVKPAQKKQHDLVNIFNFAGSDTFIPFLHKLGLRVNYLVPMATLEQIASLTEAACTAHICETLATYVAAALEEQYGVPEVKVPPPFGINWTDGWLREIAKYTDRLDLAEQVIAQEHERIQPELEKLRTQLAGKTVYVLSGDAFAHNLANIAKDLNLKVIGLSTLHHDLHFETPQQVNTLDALIKSNGNIKNVTVCNKQPYRILKLLQDIKPDVLIVRHPNLAPFGMKLGIPTLSEGDGNYSIGYDGVLKFGRRLIELLAAKNLFNNIALHAKLPYSKWWQQNSIVNFNNTQDGGL
ncbi:nitrogenase component 1 [Pectinatus cerevisiiphilus]|uniref:Nitrogenase molybdenum-iron protein alpha chain n=1 Tax=Pectinatus cerevisiiphilus TaxID=86956 RepID=A0A4R3K474_9FIRM|nr:nitrogenase component 1 [Pectinatus cerevisiiphilus]TCS77470.1 nitrogenase molybdenum-iron protein alpha chain [Pectinatus cerevisiiphilus]